jgi:hypothetical protein
MAMAQPIFQQNDNHPHIAGDRCPTCDQPVPNEKFKAIQARIDADARERSAAMERRLKEQVEQHKAQLEAKTKAEIEAAREATKKETEAAMSQKVTETEQAKAAAEQQLEALKISKAELETQSQSAIEQVKKDAAAALAKAQEETVAKEAAARESAKQEAEATHAQKLAEVEQAKNTAEQQLQAAKQEQEVVLNQRLQEQREALEKAAVDAVNAEKAKAFEERLKIDGKVQELQRQIDKKNAEELGEGAEVDLFEALKAEFPDDKINRVEKGAAGADIIHQIINNGRPCGTIVYDSKNRNAWRNEYVEKLRQDQIAARADHAVLSTRVFPSGARHLSVQDDVILVNPARTVVVAQMLRKQTIQCHTLRLSNEARTEKTAQLYDFIRSDRCTQLLNQIETLTDDMLDLDVKEKKAHDATWKRRGELMCSVQRAHSTFTGEIDQIIGAPQPIEAQA